LKKSNQKTFGLEGFGDGGANAREDQSFFASFCSQKEVLASL
jgi:hypothetical protein